MEDCKTHEIYMITMKTKILYPILLEVKTLSLFINLTSIKVLIMPLMSPLLLNVF
jgi:hypothetical protein